MKMEKFMKNRKIMIVVMSGVMALASGACSEKKTAVDVAEDKPVSATIELGAQGMQLAGITLAEAQFRDLAEAVETSARAEIIPNRLGVITPRVTGRLEQVRVYAGDHVRAGQEVASLYSAEFLSTQAEMLQIGRTLDRLPVDCSQTERAGLQDLLAATERRLLMLGLRNRDIAAVRKSGRPLELLPLITPLSGTVLESTAVNGSEVESGTALFRVADLSVLRLGADIHENEVQFTPPGSLADVTFSSFPEKTWQGRLLRLDPQVSDETHTVKGWIELTNAMEQLKPGMFATVIIRLPGESKALAVPAAAVRRIAGKTVVFVTAEKNRFLPRTVVTGASHDGWTMIVSGLSAGEKVAAGGSFALKSELLKDSLEGGE